MANDVTGLPAGIYRYEPKEHALALVAAAAVRDSVAAAARGPGEHRSTPRRSWR